MRRKIKINLISVLLIVILSCSINREEVFLKVEKDIDIEQLLNLNYKIIPEDVPIIGKKDIIGDSATFIGSVYYQFDYDKNTPSHVFWMVDVFNINAFNQELHRKGIQINLDSLISLDENYQTLNIVTEDNKNMRMNILQKDLNLEKISVTVIYKYENCPRFL